MNLLRVLIVDDDRAFAHSLAEIIRLQGHTTFVAYNATDGLQLAAEALPELILHDIVLPGMDGHEAARRLRSDARLNGTLLVAVTGCDAPTIVASTKTAGFDRLIPKPIDFSALWETIRACGSYQSVGFNF
jgi:DNA-binding response OmpR family regulator